MLFTTPIVYDCRKICLHLIIYEANGFFVKINQFKCFYPTHGLRGSPAWGKRHTLFKQIL